MTKLIVAIFSVNAYKMAIKRCVQSVAKYGYWQQLLDCLRGRQKEK
jgi:hypothetical protein